MPELDTAREMMAERMLESGRPLGYDGTNLITMDEYRPEEADSLPVLPTEPILPRCRLFAHPQTFSADRLEGDPQPRP